MHKEKSTYQFYSLSKTALQAMYESICAAKKTIYWETYTFSRDELGFKFAEKLKEKAKEGVEIKLILDGFGSWWLTEKTLSEMRSIGIEILYFNPLQLSTFWRGVRRFFERNHRKVLIVDKEIGFIGGVNVDNSTMNWFDLQVRVTGPIVRQLIKSFSRSYMAGGGTLDKIKHIFYLPIVQEKYWRVMWHKPQEKFSIVRNSYLTAIQNAKKTLTVVTPYFLPDGEILKALRAARKRGVIVKIILPFKTDHRMLTYAMRAYWRILDSFGFKIYLVKKMIHAKAMMVDDKWAMVGSSNFDDQSFYRNHDSNLVFTKKEMIDDLKKIFHNWKKDSILFRSLRWEKRSNWHRLYEKICSIFRPFL